MSLLSFPPLIDTSDQTPDEWQQVRQAAVELLQKVAPNAKVYPFFELEFDPNTLQRKVTPALYGINDDSNIFHAWMMGVTSAPIASGDNGGSEFMGGYSFTWQLTLEIEGFFDNNGDDPWQVAENEAQMATMIFFRNQDMILENAKFYKLEWSTIDLEAFADGNNLIVVQGSCRVDIQVDMTV